MISYHISYCFYLFIRFQSFSRCSSEDVCCYIRNVNPLKSLCVCFFFWQNALFHDVCYFSLCFIFTEAEMAEE